MWFYNEAQRRWEQEPAALSGHKHWVRDVAWAPNLGLSANTIASASQVILPDSQNQICVNCVMCDVASTPSTGFGHFWQTAAGRAFRLNDLIL